MNINYDLLKINIPEEIKNYFKLSEYAILLQKNNKRIIISQNIRSTFTFNQEFNTLLNTKENIIECEKISEIDFNNVLDLKI